MADEIPELAMVHDATVDAIVALRIRSVAGRNPGGRSFYWNVCRIRYS